ILFISHRLNEITELTDSITILRDGQVIDTVETEKTSIVEIARSMVGREVNISKKDDKNKIIEDESILKLKNFKVNMPGEIVKGIDLEVKKGEILGIGGLAGQGKIGIANGIMDLYESSGTTIKDNNEIPLNNPREALNSSIAFLSEDRRGVGLLLNDSIKFNIASSALEIQKKFLKKIGALNLIDEMLIRKHSLRMIEELDIRCTGPNQNTR